MEKYQGILSTIKEESALLQMIELGCKPEEIREAVIESLEPYFDNTDILEQSCIENLVPESINLLKLQKDKRFFEMFEKCLSTYRLAKSKDSQSCFESCALWQPHTLDSVSKYWSILYLEVDKDALDIQEFLHESLGNIGGIIEALTKPYLKALLHQIRIANGTKTSFEDIECLDLGQIVNELIQKSGYSDLFMPAPWNIRLNQWRNIAYHHTARVENGEIICWYGEAPKVKTIRLSRIEFRQVVGTIFNVYKALKLAYTLFFVDNVNEIGKFPVSVEVRDEAEFLSFATGLASQGFEIVEYEKNPDEAKLAVKDLSNLNPKERRFHASQFVYPLWLLTESNRVTVEYREKDNTPNLLVSTNSTACQKIASGELEPWSLAEIVEMVDLKTKKAFPTAKEDQ